MPLCIWMMEFPVENAMKIIIFFVMENYKNFLLNFSCAKKPKMSKIDDEPMKFLFCSKNPLKIEIEHILIVSLTQFHNFGLIFFS
jgi:hypothetical protein